MTTFTELGLKFPLFAADVDEATEYRGSGTCGSCSSHRDHTFATIDSALLCYTCLRDGLGCFAKFTVIGSVCGDDKLDAIGVPAPVIQGYGFETLEPHPLEPNEPDWHIVRTPPSLLCELSITPNFNCWSDCTWIFCCQRPMVYRGVWKVPDFLAHADGRGIEPFFNSVMIDEWDRVKNPDPDASWPNDALDPCGGPYVFQCAVCGGFKANNDNP